MGWKDSGDSVVYPDGTLVKGPKALCELQGYVYNAWVRMAEVFDALGKPDRAKALRAKAGGPFDRFNEAFWDEELGFYAYALDGDKKKVLTVASNAGHCLWSGIVPPERAEKVVERLMAPDMWTGWGIRTLSADHQHSIRTTIRPAPSGRTTTPSLRWASSCTALLRRRRASPMT